VSTTARRREQPDRYQLSSATYRRRDVTCVGGFVAEAIANPPLRFSALFAALTEAEQPGSMARVHAVLLDQGVQKARLPFQVTIFRVLGCHDDAVGGNDAPHVLLLELSKTMVSQHRGCAIDPCTGSCQRRPVIHAEVLMFRDGELLIVRKLFTAFTT